MERQAYLLVILAVLGVYGAVHNDNTLRYKANSANTNKHVNKMTQDTHKNPDGHLDPCTSSDPKFSLTWTPGIIKLGENIQVHFAMTPTVNLSKGKASVTIWLPDYDDPIYEVTQDFKCENIHKFVSNVCPFLKGKPVSIKRTIPVNPSLPLPGGSFRVKLNVINEESKVFACIAGNITIANSYNSYDYDGY